MIVGSTVDRHFSVIPHPQTIIGAHPYTSISARHHRAPSGDSSKAFVLGVRRDRVVAKTIEPAQGGDPNITFAIFEERGNEIAGESISLRKYVGASVMEMHNTGSRGSNPDAAIAVPEKYLAPSTLRAGAGYGCCVSSFPPPNRASLPGKGIKRVPSPASPRFWCRRPSQMACDRTWEGRASIAKLRHAPPPRARRGYLHTGNLLP